METKRSCKRRTARVVEYVIADEKVEQERFVFDRNAAEQFLKRKEIFKRCGKAGGLMVNSSRLSLK